MAEITRPALFYSPEEFGAAIGGHSARTVYRMIAEGEIPAVRIHGKTVIPAPDAHAYMERIRAEAGLCAHNFAHNYSQNMAQDGTMATARRGGKRLVS